MSDRQLSRDQSIYMYMTVRRRGKQSWSDCESWSVHVDVVVLRSVEAAVDHLVDDVEGRSAESFRHEQVDVAEAQERGHHEQEHEAHATEDLQLRESLETNQ